MTAYLALNSAPLTVKELKDASVMNSPLKNKKPLFRHDMNRMHVEEMRRQDVSAGDFHFHKKHSVGLTQMSKDCSICKHGFPPNSFPEREIDQIRK